MEKPKLTEERLRTWVLEQSARERLCIGILALEPGFSRVRPRRPKGGPDGGRDLEALLDAREEVWGAVGFRNNANDSPEDKKWVRNKFSSDLKRALQENPKLFGFVFFTNVDLTPAELKAMELDGHVHGLQSCEVFHRERIRIALDSPQGFAYRLQYLDIEMSREEQVAFFDRLVTQVEFLRTLAQSDVQPKTKVFCRRGPYMPAGDGRGWNGVSQLWEIDFETVNSGNASATIVAATVLVRIGEDEREYEVYLPGNKPTHLMPGESGELCWSDSVRVDQPAPICSSLTLRLAQGPTLTFSPSTNDEWGEWTESGANCERA